MIWEDLPPSVHVEDRRGEVKPGSPTITINEVMDMIAAGQRLVVPIAPSDPTSELAKQLGVDDIARRVKQ